jgi:tryptophan synthase alpha chain
VPFSDPIADGPDIQRASEAALANGVGVNEVLGLVEALRRESELPVVLMTYANPILRGGIDAFATRARDAGVDGVLVSDLPPDESPEVWAAFDRAALDTITLIAPTTDDARLPLLLGRARGFVYCLARTGVTGAGAGTSGPLPERIAAIRKRTTLPVAVGFGVSNAERARALKGVADAVVVGAAFMRTIADAPGSLAAERVHALATELMQALAS